GKLQGPSESGVKSSGKLSSRPEAWCASDACGASMKERVEQAVRTVRDRCAGTPAVGLVLGSGWGPIAESSRTATIIPYAEISGFPGCFVEGPAGDLVIDSCLHPLRDVLAGRPLR